MKKELVLENSLNENSLNNLGVTELNRAENEAVSGGGFGPFGAGFRVWFRVNTESLFGDPLMKNPVMA